MREFIVKEYETFPYKGAVHEMPELIRCKDCKHYEYVDVFDCMLCTARDDFDEPICAKLKPDDYCSRAERKEE